MSGEIYMAATGALAYEKRLQLIANNLANVNTSGYKKDISSFQMYNGSDLANNSGYVGQQQDLSQANEFWIKMDTSTDFSSGFIKNTGNNLDMAILGEGFFSVQTPNGVRYTRNGEFSLSEDGNLVTKDGYAVMGEGGEIKVESKAAMTDPERHELAVDEEGYLSLDGKRVGRFKIVKFEDPNSLQKEGYSLFKTEADGVGESKAEDFTVSQGFLEVSNVGAVRMMTEMIEVLRGYESYQKVIRSIDEINARAINEVSQTS